MGVSYNEGHSGCVVQIQHDSRPHRTIDVHSRWQKSCEPLVKAAEQSRYRRRGLGKGGSGVRLDRMVRTVGLLIGVPCPSGGRLRCSATAVAEQVNPITYR